MAREFTRQSLYELVWSKPITHVAKEFALSDVAVHKICRKHGIPTPPLGWWTKMQAGKPVKQTPLPSAPANSADRIVITTLDLSKEGGSLADARQQARIRASSQDSSVSRSFPIIDRTITALRQADVAYNGLSTVSGPSLISCEVSKAALDRLKLFLSRLAAAAEVQGFQLKDGERGVQFAGDGETIHLRVTETVKRVKHELTAQEQKLQDARDAKVEREAKRRTWNLDYSSRPFFAEWDYICTGQLSLEMETAHIEGRQGPRSTFRDAKIQRLDKMAEDISVALAVLAVAKRDARERRDQAECIRLEEKRRREQPLRAKHIAQRRREGLDSVLVDLANLDRLRRMLAGLKDIKKDGASTRVSEFLSRAQIELNVREEALSASGLHRRFEETRLFGDDDDHGFKSPLWY
ncbi:phage tail tape measure protein [Sphingomonas bacterium]|uniref:phage tail tape measure protein n=1 Tax=Sphingomonas bacterium TaxID=1895847 RepID=UPI001576551B|nr:phage tail tape measure protein [Sphingomonas bacterium]